MDYGIRPIEQFRKDLIVRTLSNHDRSGSRSLLDKTDDEQIAREIDHKSIMLKAGLRLGLTPQQIGTI